MKIVGLLGQGFLAVTLGAIFAGVYAAAVAALVGRLASFQELWSWIFHP
jgi:DNA gyrase inhibitor GyrI